jgi:hypothetical protein
MLVLYNRDIDTYLDVESVAWVKLANNRRRTLEDYVSVNQNRGGKKVTRFLDSVYGCWHG